ncbi:MAG: DUF4160 domain-containing protein [Fibrobacterota bacterium]
MPTVLLINGWRFYFYANERNEPIHIHCKKGEKEAKYWIVKEQFSVEEAFSFRMNNRDQRQVKKIIYTYFELIEKEWEAFKKGVRK